MSLYGDFVKFLNENLPTAPSFHPHYESALSDMLKAGGKHFRALLLLGVVNALKPQNLAASMRVALGVELLHTYSLIHDDLPVMDNASLRRGVPTLHVRYDEVTAVLAGDALNTHAFYEISRANLSSEIRIKCVEILSQNGGASGMVLGQAIDCFFEKKPLTLDELKFLHTHKTAKLIAASLKMGAVIAECDEKMCDEIYEIGLDLGLAFQIQDDIIDATSDESEAGKPVHNDGVKNSFTNLLGISGAINAKNELIHNIQNRLKQLPNSVSNVVLELTEKHLK
ncbi:polyprenyl synthetase family protein [Campylobacter mucosalis]|uniref:polyprenyl synthetase family protein n=1 Tax=Campylobacter mucosalis TaxID=202 RepID=UPI00147059DD